MSKVLFEACAKETGDDGSVFEPDMKSELEAVIVVSRDWTSWLGREAVVNDSIDPWRARALSHALELEGADPGAGDPLPATWHWVYFLESHAHSQLGRDGHLARGAFLPPGELPSRMWAAGSIAVGGEVPRLGSRARRISRIQRVEEKTGRSGPLCFVTVCHSMGGLVEEQLIVYRTVRRKGARAESFAPTATAEWRREWNADERMLFRYSALTFNAHRIHYDLDWCRRVEGYPGLVVHGPLLATAMFDLACGIARSLGKEIAHFSFRAVAPVFHTETFRACGTAAESSAQLWIEGPDGRGRMWGSATWRDGKCS